MQLKDYQEYGAAWLSQRKHALLADGMGVGKTAQTIRACDILVAGRILVVCPAIATTNWRREFELWDVYARSVHVIADGKDTPIAEGVNIVSYDLMAKPAVYRKLAATRPHLLVLDEAHYLKNPEAKRAKVVFGNKRNPHIRGLLPQSKRTWALTGTPKPRDQRDLWVWLHHFGVYTKSYAAFEREFCEGYRDLHDRFVVTGIKNTERLRGLLDQIMLRRRLKDVSNVNIEVPIETFIIDGTPVDDELLYGLGKGKPAKEKQDMKTVKGHQMIRESYLQRTDDEILAELAQLKHGRGTPVSTVRRHVGLLKVANAAAFIKEKLDGDYPYIVVFAIHKHVITGLADALHIYNPITLWGGMKQAKKDKKILEFERGKSRLAICNMSAAGTAIRFKMADAVVIVEPDWNPDNNAQAIARCLWMDRDRPLPVWYLSLADSFDERVNQVIARKTVIDDALFS